MRRRCAESQDFGVLELCFISWHRAMELRHLRYFMNDPIAVGLVDHVTREQIAARPAALRLPALLVPRAAALLQLVRRRSFGRSHRAGHEPVRASQRGVAKRIL
jgi:hypothetical protein